MGDLIALHGFQLDTWIDPKTRDEKMPTFLEPDQGGEPRVLGGKGIGYQKHLPASSRSRAGTPPRSSPRATTVTHILNGHVVNRGKGVRLVDPDIPTHRPGRSPAAGSRWRSRRPSA